MDDRNPGTISCSLFFFIVRDGASLISHCCAHLVVKEGLSQH